MTSIRVACVQMRSGRDPAANLADFEALVRQAAAGGAAYVQSPEMTNLLERDRTELFRKISPEGADPFVRRGAELARELGITLHIGSLAILRDDGKVANRAFVFAPDGSLAARYDKIHMFDVDLANGESWRESATYTPGEQAVIAEVGPLRIGLAICYDVRFPQLFRSYGQAGVNILTAPAAFTRQTGRAHWHVLERSRAIENGCYLVTAAQGGTHEDGRETYGHSLVVDPWGEVITEAAHDDPAVIFADLDLEAVGHTRGRIPSLANGRAFAAPQ